ncbi:MAG TPA: helix-turn-helix domain-containing protein [Terriglobales bacterium]|nr:helix-turn-helix domain-containing protein [Terriglobales bacterium]
MKRHFGCPVQATSKVLARKWKVLMVWHLSFGTRHFAEIRDLLPGVTERVLTDILHRLVTESVPWRVDSTLTAAGNELISVMEAVQLGHKASGSSAQHPSHPDPAVTRRSTSPVDQIVSRPTRPFTAPRFQSNT